MRQAFILLAVVSGFLLSGCGSTKTVPANDKLYTGATVTVNGAGSVRERKVLRHDLNSLTRPKPNSNFLGIRFKLGFYNLFHKSKKMREKLGEPPVLASELDLQKNIDILQN